MRPADDAAARDELIRVTALEIGAEVLAEKWKAAEAELARLRARIAALTPMVLGPEHEYIAGEWLHRGDVLDLLGGSE